MRAGLLGATIVTGSTGGRRVAAAMPRFCGRAPTATAATAAAAAAAGGGGRFMGTVRSSPGVCDGCKVRPHLHASSLLVDLPPLQATPGDTPRLALRCA